MTKQEKEKLRLRLLEMIKKSQQEIEQFADAVKPIAPENSLGRISRMDAINNKGVAEAALRAKKKKLSKMKMALSNLDSPSFGLCEYCDQPINPNRLIFMPESSTCVRCADR